MACRGEGPEDTQTTEEAPGLEEVAGHTGAPLTSHHGAPADAVLRAEKGCASSETRNKTGRRVPPGPPSAARPVRLKS